jgi:hypothetical protein
MNVKIGSEAAQFTEKEYINRIFVAVYEKGSFLGWFVRLVVPEKDIFILPWLLKYAQYKIFFPQRTNFTPFVLNAQQAAWVGTWILG